MTPNWSLRFVPDFAINHLQNNTLLEEGQIGIEKDTGKFKIGDGVTGWNSLQFTTIGGFTSIWMGASTKDGNLITHSNTDGGVFVDTETFNGRVALMGGINGTYTLDNINAYYTAVPHLGAIANIGVMIRNVLTSMGVDFANTATAPTTQASLQTRIEDIERDLTTGNINLTALLRDDLTQNSTTWSSTKIDNTIRQLTIAAISDIVGAAPEALNTIYELADFLMSNQDMVQTLTIEIGQMVKFVSQTLTVEQQSQARTNIGAASASDVGFVSETNNRTLLERFNAVFEVPFTAANPLQFPSIC